MIQANELRIGNWVDFQYSFKGEYKRRPCQVKEIKENGILVIDKGLDLNLPDGGQPIPLTAEILEAAGFVFNHKSASYRIFSHKEEWILAVQQTTDKTIFKIGLPTDGRSDQYMTSFHSLHQLQNLYFSLTSTELNYKPLK